MINHHYVKEQETYQKQTKDSKKTENKNPQRKYRQETFSN